MQYIVMSFPYCEVASFSETAVVHQVSDPIGRLTCTTPSSQPLITSCLPILNLKGLSRSREESNLRPSVREP